MPETERSKVLRASYNVLMMLISDIQRYDRIEIKPKFARELNDVTKSLAAVINELEAKNEESTNAG